MLTLKKRKYIFTQRLYMTAHRGITFKKNWEQPGCPSAGARINTSWFSRTVEHHSGRKRNGLPIRAITYKSLNNCWMKCRTTTTRGQACVSSPGLRNRGHRWGLEQQDREVLGAGSPRSRHWQVCSLSRPLPSACRRTSIWCLHKVVPLCVSVLICPYKASLMTSR